MRLEPVILRPALRLKRPWQRRRARPFRREVVAFDRPPLAQIDIYAECIILTRRRPDGRWTQYPISPDALAQVLGRLPASTGLLPSGMLATGMRDGAAFYVQYIPARVVTLQVAESAERLLRVPLPPLIWAGWGRNYRIWAVASAPEALNERTPLDEAPLPNVARGGICWGNVGSRRPADPATMGATLKLFLEESQFNAHRSNGKSQRQPGNILRLLEQLDPAEPYPLDDLVPSSYRLSDVLSGAIWRGAQP